MKVKQICLLLIVCTIFASEIYAKPDKSKEIIGTPENSVLVYGGISYLTNIFFAQMDPNYAPDFQKAKLGKKIYGATFYLNPVAPGTRYSTVFYYIENSNWYATRSPSLQGSFFDFTVPNKPGLYFYGLVSGFDSVKRNKKVDFKLELFGPAASEKNCLKAMLKDYEGTAWEKVINERIDEINKEEKAEKAENAEKNVNENRRGNENE